MHMAVAASLASGGGDKKDMKDKGKVPAPAPSAQPDGLLRKAVNRLLSLAFDAAVLYALVAVVMGWWDVFAIFRTTPGDWLRAGARMLQQFSWLWEPLQ